MDIQAIIAIILRLFHIFGAVIWAGIGFFSYLSLDPLVKKLGPEGKRLQGILFGQSNLMMIFPLAGASTILSGILLYIKDSAMFAGNGLAWVGTGQGIVFGIGGLAGIGAMVMGARVLRPLVEQAQKIGAEIQAAGGKPTPEQAQTMASIEERMERINRIDFILLVVAVITMATARYF
jgi:hypothetical protein